MKILSFFLILASSAVGISSIVVGSDVVQAKSEYKFTCEPNSQGTPTTVVILPGGEKRDVINWRSDAFNRAGYKPQVRCEQVTARINKYTASGAGQYITHGTMNNLPVLCVSNKLGNGCTGLLYTLKPSQDAKETLRDFLELNRRNFQNDPLMEGKSCRTYVNIRAMVTGKLKRAEVVCSTN
jgi:Circadian oscillating protein COP23